MRQHANLQLAAAGHGLAVIVGLCAIIAGGLALANGLPVVLGITLLVLGGMLPAVAHFSWRMSRAAWSVMISTLCVFAAVTLFGSPKIAGVMHVDLGIALLIPIVQVAAVIVLAQIRADYREL
ncbi:MAG TPA: hypothetical protein VIV58_24775 [Kofleriaceae bacterium]